MIYFKRHKNHHTLKFLILKQCMAALRDNTKKDTVEGGVEGGMPQIRRE
jgi:hypothetical protein